MFQCHLQANVFQTYNLVLKAWILGLFAFTGVFISFTYTLAMYV